MWRWGQGGRAGTGASAGGGDDGEGRGRGHGGTGMGRGKVWKEQKSSTLLDLCVSSLRRGHANLLCIVPILTDVPRKESREWREHQQI